MSDPKRAVVAVNVIGGDSAAPRLAVGWGLVDPALTGRAMFVAWARASAVPLSQTLRVGEILLRHQLCRADRSLDPEVDRVLQALAGERLHAAKRRAR